MNLNLLHPYIVIYKRTNTVLIATVPQVYSQECPAGTAYTAYTQKYGCVSNGQCSNFYQCTADGYFENPNDNDCSTVIKCA